MILPFITVKHFAYESFNGEWSPLRGGFWGNAFLLDVAEHSGDHFTVNNLLFVEEDSADTYQELDEKLSDPEQIIFDKICDEVFGEG